MPFIPVWAYDSLLGDDPSYTETTFWYTTFALAYFLVGSVYLTIVVLVILLIILGILWWDNSVQDLVRPRFKLWVGVVLAAAMEASRPFLGDTRPWLEFFWWSINELLPGVTDRVWFRRIQKSFLVLSGVGLILMSLVSHSYLPVSNTQDSADASNDDGSLAASLWGSDSGFAVDGSIDITRSMDLATVGATGMGGLLLPMEADQNCITIWIKQSLNGDAETTTEVRIGAADDDSEAGVLVDGMRPDATMVQVNWCLRKWSQSKMPKLSGMKKQKELQPKLGETFWWGSPDEWYKESFKRWFWAMKGVDMDGIEWSKSPHNMESKPLLTIEMPQLLPDNFPKVTVFSKATKKDGKADIIKITTASDHLHLELSDSHLEASDGGHIKMSPPEVGMDSDGRIKFELSASVQEGEDPDGINQPFQLNLPRAAGGGGGDIAGLEDDTLYD